MLLKKNKTKIEAINKYVQYCKVSILTIKLQENDNTVWLRDLLISSLVMH